ncbi:hypothetical protein [Bacillus andreraoultii]|uniref:hypothetical protein n=1 Tax=Bacillus andreraoultii TaxID=1499685 RepID=UPI00067E9790|nr:hypothetical protein [Bacillus andreraoultii]
MKFFRMILIFTLLLVLAACSDKKTPASSEAQKGEKQEAKNEHQIDSTLEEVLAEDTNADLFYLNGIVFVNAGDLKWVKELDNKIGDKIAEIKKQTTNPEEIKDQTATILPVGTKIYKLEDYPGPVYIAVVDEKEIPYLGLIE